MPLSAANSPLIRSAAIIIVMALCLLFPAFRNARLNHLSEERAQKLEDSKKLQQFLRDVDEV